ncbi:MAG: VgrG-related protein [Gaiellaceae bacterium]
MSDVDTSVMLDLVEVKIDGVPVDNHLIQEVRVQDSLSLPTAFSITFAPRDLGRGVDPLAVQGVDPSIGAEVAISLGAPRDSQKQKLAEGEITALEPNFAPEGIRLVASGYDKSHRLHRNRKTRTFQRMTSAQIVQKVVSEVGLSAQVDATTPQHEFVQQNNETDWEFIHRLASMLAYEVVIEGRRLRFGKIPESGRPLELEYGVNTSNGSAVRLHTFYPRATSAQQIKEVVVRGWDAKTKREIVGKATVQQRGSKIGISRQEVLKSFGAGVITVADAPVATVEEANALALSVGWNVGDGFVGAFGTCEGNPRVKAGAWLKVKGLGAEFSGTYRCSATTHVYGGGYSTSFEVLGRSPRDLLDLARPVTKNTWGDTLVVGIVTNNDDPEKLARVRVKYPTLDDENEGAWARVVAVGAGPERGQLMLPQVGDEVLIGFEGGNPHRPYVLGALWNGKDKPRTEHWDPRGTGKPDGSYVLRSPKHIDIAAVEDVVIKADKDMTVVVKGKSTETVEKTQEMTVKQSFKLDAATELTLVCGRAKIVLKQDGTINIEGGNVTVSGQMGTTVKGTKVDVQGTGPVTVKGATVAIN